MAENQTFGSRLRNAWNVFFNNKDPSEEIPVLRYEEIGPGYSYRPDRSRYSRGTERTVVTAIFNRIAMDAAAIDIEHVRLDDNGRLIDIINSDLNNCLTVEANIDQTGRMFMQDAVMSILDEGCIAIVPVDTSVSPWTSNTYDILTMRVGKIVEWHPKVVKVNVYNDRTGNKEDVVLPKSDVAIIENPLYSVVNEPNSTLQRLIRKLNLLDVVDEQTSAGKLDLIIQLPYVIKSEARMQQAETRRKQIEDQLMGSKYGIAYTDGTERITQLNRPIENNLMKQIEYLTELLYSQLGITKEILNGTADEQAMTNYYSRTIEPILAAIADEMKRKFLTKTARTQGQSIEFFRDPFKLIPVTEVAKIADTFTRNCIATSNEIRQAIGWCPSDDPNADKLINNNLNQPADTNMAPMDEGYDDPMMDEYEDPEIDGASFINGDTPVSMIRNLSGL